MCLVYRVSRCGNYAWRRQGPNQPALEDEEPVGKIRRGHDSSRQSPETPHFNWLPYSGAVREEEGVPNMECLLFGRSLPPPGRRTVASLRCTAAAAAKRQAVKIWPQDPYRIFIFALTAIR